MIKAKLKSIYKNIKRNALEKEMWQIAIRKRDGDTLYQGNRKGFRLVSNSIRYWRADPFLYEKDDKTFLFAELFDRFEDKGVLAVAKVSKNGRVGHFNVCLDMPFHLSYPCLFEKEGSLYMIPEGRQSGEISIYRCVDFPLKWEKDRVLFSTTGVDTTPVPQELCGDKEAFITTVNTEQDHNNNLYLIQADSLTKIKYNDTCVRCGGYFINDKEKWLRVVQDDTDYYGCRLVFNEVRGITSISIDESEYLSVLPPGQSNGQNEISVSLTNSKEESKFVGIHTYNKSSKFEVIDLVRHDSRTWKVWAANRIKKKRKK